MKKRTTNPKKAYSNDELRVELLREAEVVMKLEDLSRIFTANVNPLWVRMKQLSDEVQALRKAYIGFVDTVEALKKSRRRK